MLQQTSRSTSLQSMYTTAKRRFKFFHVSPRSSPNVTLSYNQNIPTQFPQSSLFDMTPITYLFLSALSPSMFSLISSSVQFALYRNEMSIITGLVLQLW
mmetsp:Transcript_6118/g.11963  ORF Transcript_6118/g.11963 Transcript_6118/m.11963 type:complete len:99 (+) Transcript_6118:5392-5688(+)